MRVVGSNKPQNTRFAAYTGCDYRIDFSDIRLKSLYKLYTMLSVAGQGGHCEYRFLNINESMKGRVGKDRSTDWTYTTAKEALNGLIVIKAREKQNNNSNNIPFMAIWIE